MKKLINRILSIALMAGILAAAGCEKNKGPEGNGGNGGNGGETNPVAGTYILPKTPLYSNLTAKDPSAAALELNGGSFTYAQLILAASATIPSQQVFDSELEVTLNTDGTLKVIEKDPEHGDLPVFPDPSDYLPADAITYELNGNTFSLILSADIMNDIMDAESDPLYAAQMKGMLSKLTKGMVVYSPTTNTCRINFLYKLSGNELSLYADKDLLLETWSGGKGVLEDILPVLREVDPEAAALIEAIIPQVEPALEGFSTIEIGLKLTKK